MLMIMDDDVCNICFDVCMYLHTSIYTHSSARARWKLQTVALGASASAEFVAFTNDFQSFLKFSWWPRQRCLRETPGVSQAFVGLSMAERSPC